MPIFGEYETVLQISITEEPRLVTTVWKVRKSGETDGRLFVIKNYASRPGRITPSQPPDELQQDWSLSFLEGIKRLKRARTGEASCLAPVHAFGLTPEGAWYATDYYERRTLKEYIDLLGRVDSDALRQVVYSAVTGCLAIKRSGEGKTHGNLKPSNLLLAGKPCPLQRTHLHLTDPHPAPRQLAALDTADQRTGGDLPDKTMEIQDLRAIGELILQLVEGRLLRNAYEYNYPIERSDKWDKLGKAGESWRALCNRLLDPRLSLEKESLEQLEAVYRPKVPTVKPAVILAVLGGILVLGIASYLVLAAGRTIKAHRAQQEQRYQELTNTAGLAYRQGDYTNARAAALRALAIKANDPSATKLRVDAQREINRMDVAGQQEQEFRRLTNAAVVAYQQGNYATARAEAVRALGIKTNDPVATKLRDDAQREFNRMDVARRQEQEFQQLTNAAWLAYQQGNYSNAWAQAVRALDLKTNDPVATKLRDDAQQEIIRMDVARQKEEEFRRLTNAAWVAYQQGSYAIARAEAVRALDIKTNDPAAIKLRDDAQQEINRMEVARQKEEELRQLINSAGAAIKRGNYIAARADALKALDINANDPVATKLRDIAQREIDRMDATRQREEQYRWFTNAAWLAYQQGNYTNARAEAVRALDIRTNDPGAIKLRDDSQAQLNLATKAKGLEVEHSRSSHLATALGYDTNRLGFIERATLLIGENVNPKRSFSSLGKLDDIALDLTAGKVVMALVSSGAEESGTRVPARSFSAASRMKREIDVDKKTFSSAPRVPKANWTGGLNASSLGNIARQFGNQEPLEEASSPAGFSSVAALIHRPLASETGKQLGQVEDLMIDLPGGRLVFLVVKPVAGSDSDNRLYVLPPASVGLNTNGLVLKAGLEQFVAGPHFSKEFWTQLRVPDFAASVYQYYASLKGGADVVDPK